MLSLVFVYPCRLVSWAGLLFDSIASWSFLFICCKTPKNSDTRKIGCNHPKIWTRRLYRRVVRPKDADEMANNVDPDQRSSLILVCTVCPEHQTNLWSLLVFEIWIGDYFICDSDGWMGFKRNWIKIHTNIVSTYPDWTCKAEMSNMDKKLPGLNVHELDLF